MRETYNQMSERIFKDLDRKRANRDKLINTICEESNLSPVIRFLNESKTHSKLKISLNELQKNLEYILGHILEDLKDYKSLLKTNHEPVKTIKHLNSLVSHLNSVEEIWKTNPLLHTIMDSLFGDGDFETTEGSKRLSAKEANKLLNSETRITGTVDILRDKSKTITKMAEHLIKNLNEQNLWAYRLHHFPLEKKALFYVSFPMKNKMLFVIAYHLDSLAKKIGIKSQNGRIDFVIKTSPVITKHIGQYFEEMGSIQATVSNINGLYRTKSWESLHK